MTTGALLFMATSWTVVLGLAGWAYWRILRPRSSRPSHEADGHKGDGR